MDGELAHAAGSSALPGSRWVRHQFLPLVVRPPARGLEQSAILPGVRLSLVAEKPAVLAFETGSGRRGFLDVRGLVGTETGRLPGMVSFSVSEGTGSPQSDLAGQRGRDRRCPARHSATRFLRKSECVYRVQASSESARQWHDVLDQSSPTDALCQ